MAGKSLVPAALPPGDDQNTLALQSIYLFRSFHEVMSSQMAVHGFHLPNARPVIASAYNRTRQKSLAHPFIHLPILHRKEQRMGTAAKRSFLSLNKGHLVG